MSDQPNPSSPRQRFRAERQRRQAITFSVMGAILAVVLLFNLAILTGMITLPFPSAFNAKIEYAEAGDTPCPTPGAVPVAPGDIKVQVLNTTDRAGLAKGANDMLIAAGYTPVEPANSEEEYPGRVRISSGPAGVDKAYTVARFFPKSSVKLTDATDDSVFIELGTFYDTPLPQEEVNALVADATPLKGLESCLGLNPDGSAGEAPASGAQSGAQSGAGEAATEPQSAQ
ncbi:MAG: LytR C-terminal domain-containing protein [Actinomycetaceae bacterium]|nr:LytR C-terminal domain-containing protein [Actinomycetaceae bacterium]